MESKKNDRILPHAKWKARTANDVNKVLPHAHGKKELLMIISFPMLDVKQEK